MRTRAVVVIALTAWLVSACASIPESTPVQVVGENLGAGEEEPTPAAPLPGMHPLAVVRKFVEAGSSHTNNHQGARAYLTADAGRAWDDTSVTYVLDNQFDTAPTASIAPDVDQRQQVALRTHQLGRLAPNGVFGLERRELPFILNLVKEAGEWRIANPPSGLLMRFQDFRSSYRGVELSYVDASANVLVNDRRWVLNRPKGALPSRVINLLLGEPSADLTNAVTSELRGARTRTNVALGPDGVLTVDLTGVQDLNEIQRELAAAQIVGSLEDFVPEPVRILVDGEPLIPDKAVWRAADVERFEPAVEVSAGLPGLVVTGGRVIQIGSGGELRGVAPLVVQSIAQSADGLRLAVVAVDAGLPRLWVGRAGALQPVELAATTMSRPTWRRDRAEVWTVVDGKRLIAVLAGDGPPRAHTIDAAELNRRGKISELRISRDGVRLAAIVDNSLVLGSVVGVGAQSSVRNVRVLAPSSPVQVVDVDWIGTDQLVVATASKDTPVIEASLDGLTWRSFGTSNLTPPVTRIAAVVNRPVLVADQTGVWSATMSGQVWQPVGHGPGAIPVYPG